MNYRPKTYHINTFGCQMNQLDSERIAGDYQARGLTQAKNWRQADEIVINTCSVRQRAEDRVVGFLKNIADYFSNNPKACLPVGRPKIILTGCMIHHGSRQLHKLLPIIDEILPIVEVGFNQPAVRKSQTHAWVPISTGCNSFCTYCIVPYSRGREKSRPLNDIFKETKDLTQKGYQEITLLGMNVNSWGLEKVGISHRKSLMTKNQKFTPKDLPTNQSQYLKPQGTPPFVKLLQKISQIKGIKKIRFLTSNPWDFYDELINEIAHNHKIDRYIHLPVQSGSDRILKRMNRGYTRTDYLKLVNKIKKKIPNVVLGTDIIVGFPGETKKDFLDTVDLVKKVNFQVAFIAQYSPRPNTVAWKNYQDIVSSQEKKRRWQILDNLINKKHLQHRPKIIS